MKKIRTLLVKFDNELEPWEVSAFRGAIVEKVGREHLLFHQHVQDNQYLYRYPLIQYKSISDEISRMELLEKILIGNLISFAKGIGWDIKREIKVRISKILKTKNLKYKNTHLLAFGIEFSGNFSLPTYLGLGKGVSHGYGVVSPLKNFKK